MTTPTDPTGLPISTTLPGMAAALPTFDSALQEVSGILSAMTTQQDTLEANWKGDTASNFGIAVDAFLGDLSKMQGALADLLSNMGQNSKIISTIEDDTQQTRQAFAQGLSSVQGLPGLSL